MAVKKKTVFFCQNCGYESAKWMGQCPACHEWNSFVEEPKEKAAAGSGIRRRGTASKPVLLRDVSSLENERTLVGMPEFDRVLGGGIVKGSLVLIGGDPGIGKSTILLQAAELLAAKGKKILYISGEESLAQIRMRAERLGAIPDGLFLFCETNLGDIREVIETEKPDICVVDSIQTMFNEEVASAPGSVSQVRESTNVLMMLAKGLGVSIFIVGHVTKEGAVAGPRVLEHMVDTVLYFEGDRYASYRILRAVKNRFGSTNEIGVFEMREAGLAEVPNPSEYMLSGRPEARTAFGVPRRTAAGCDYNRVNLLLAVLEKRCGLDMSSCDAYINIAGGIRLNEPALDLGIVLAAASSLRDIEIPESVCAFGEVGLAGEVRAVGQAENRVREAKRLGFKRVIVPRANMAGLKKIGDIEIVPVGTAREAIFAAEKKL